MRSVNREIRSINRECRKNDENILRIICYTGSADTFIFCKGTCLNGKGEDGYEFL